METMLNSFFFFYYINNIWICQIFNVIYENLLGGGAAIQAQISTQKKEGRGGSRKKCGSVNLKIPRRISVYYICMYMYVCMSFRKFKDPLENPRF